MKPKRFLLASIAAIAGFCFVDMSLAANVDGPRSTPASAAANSGRVILMAMLTVKAGDEQQFLDLFARMRVRQQDHGNIRYDLYRSTLLDPPSGSAQAASQFVFIEEWRDGAAAQAHGKWAGPIVMHDWRMLTDKMQILSLRTPE